MHRCDFVDQSKRTAQSLDLRGRAACALSQEAREFEANGVCVSSHTEKDRKKNWRRK